MEKYVYYEECREYNEFVRAVISRASKYPRNWRFGQRIFNAVDELYGVARDVQFGDGVDCFYNDENSDEFMEKSWERIKQYK